MATASPARVLPAGITIRYGTEDDLPECNRIWRESIDGYLQPMGFQPLPTENLGLRRLHAHTMATSPERFLVAERRRRVGGRRIVAFGSAIERGALWFLSMLFVEPGEQARGLGRLLLDRLLPEDRDARILVTCTDSAQPISNALYASVGIVPRMPMFNFVGRPREGWVAPPLPPGIAAQRVQPRPDGLLDGAIVAELGAFDEPLLGFEHPDDHAFDLRERPSLFTYRDASGALAGYGYTSEVGRVGPIAVRDGAMLAPVFAHLLVSVVPRGASSVWLPGAAGEPFRLALEAGLRIEGFPTIVCWNRPFADFTRYVPTSPGLI